MCQKYIKLFYKVNQIRQYRLIKKSKNKKMLRKFGVDIQNLVKQKSNNHIVLKSRSFSFDGKTKPPAHIVRKSLIPAEQIKPLVPQNNKTAIDTPVISDNRHQILPNIQKDDQYVPGVLHDCIKHMRKKQNDMMERKNILQEIKIKNQEYLSKRGAIVDWMVNIHYKLKLFPQTLFIAVYYMDSFCSRQAITKQEEFMVSATCLFIAGKFQQTYRIPSIKNLQDLTEKEYKREDFIRMEERIMEQLGFSLIVDTPIKYLELFAKISNLSQKNFFIGHYILQLSLVESSFIQFNYSILGSAVTYLVNKIRKLSPAWPQEIKQLSGYQESDLKTCAKNLCSLLERSQELENGKNIRSKFSKTQFCSASNIRLQRKNQ